MTLKSASERGFSVLYVILILISVVLVLSTVLTYAARSYRLEKYRTEKLQLTFAARSGLTVTAEDLLDCADKPFTSFSHLSSSEKDFFLQGFRVKTLVEDENAKINIKKIKQNSQHKAFSFLNSGSRTIMEDILSSEVSPKDPSGFFFTSFGDGRININTASGEVLGLFFHSSGDLRLFLKERKENPLTNLSEVEYVRQTYFQKTLPLLNIPFTIKSNCFTIISKAQSTKQSVTVRAVFIVQNGKAEQIFFEQD